MYALVNYSGNQILVKEGEQTKIPFTDQKVGSKLVFDNVLFVDDGKTKIIGSPYIKSYSIDANIVSHGKDKKIIVFKKKRRKGYQKKNGHRQNYTLVQVDKISSSFFLHFVIIFRYFSASETQNGSQNSALWLHFLPKG